MLLKTLITVCMILGSAVLGVGLGDLLKHNREPATVKAQALAPIIQTPIKQGLIETAPQDIEVIELSKKNMVVMDAEFSDESVTRVMQELQKLSNSNAKDATLYLVLNSPGGSVTSGQLLISFARALPQKVKTITIFAASMAFQTVQSLDERLILETGTLMSHRAKFGVQGQGPGEIFSRLNYIMSMVDALDANAAHRMGMSFDDYRNLIHDEYWVFGQKGVSDKAADRTVLAKCAKELNGTRTTTIETMFGAVEIELSECPLMPGILGAKMKNGAAENEDKALNYVKEMYTDRAGFVKDFVMNNKFEEYQKHN